MQTMVQYSHKQGGQQMSALDRLKSIQATFKQKWNGIDTRATGRPGKLHSNCRHLNSPQREADFRGR